MIIVHEEKKQKGTSRLLRLLPAWATTPAFARLFRYVIVGGLTTVVSMGTYLVLAYVLHWEDIVAHVLADVVAVLFAYVASKFFVFRSRCADGRALVKEAISFFAGRAATILLDSVLFYWLVTRGGWPDVWVRFGLIVVVTVLNYFLARYVSFRGRDSVSSS